MFKNTYIKILVWSFYHLGDFFSNFPWQWTFNLYQKCMNHSVNFDEKIGFWLWQEPPLNTEKDYENL